MPKELSHHVDELLVAAKAAGESDDWPAARALASAVLALEPGNPAGRALIRDADAQLHQPGERRQLTVMFCDVVGSTAMSARTDPEMLRDVLMAYQAACDDVISKYDGYIARYFGDGVLAYFGYPRAHEDDARRAVKAGLDLLGVVGELSAAERSLHDVDLAVRVAVHTGLVVRAEMGTPANPDRDAIVGETPNLAARLQECAAPGSLVISSDTYALVEGYFEVEPLGKVELRGITRPIEAYQVVDEVNPPRRRVRGVARSPFVGRDTEMADLLERWKNVRNGGHGCVLVRGEPGMGKSRLSDELRAIALDAGSVALMGGCSAYQTSTHLYPARRLVEAAVGITTRERDHALRLLHDALTGIGAASATPLFASLLGIPAEPWCPAPELDGLRLREETLAAMVDCLVALGESSPFLIVVEDLQWADPSTIELIGRVLSRKPAGMVLVLTARPEFAPPWTVDTIELARMGPTDLVTIARAMGGPDPLPAATVDEAIVRSDGVPLYFEELVRSASLARSGRLVDPASLTRFEIPAPLLDPLLARLGAPSVDLDLVQTMATIGREVSRDLLSAVVGGDGLDDRIRGLIDAGLLDADGAESGAYRFHHHLIRELAYETQLLPARKKRHGQIADALRTITPSGSGADAGAIAYHLEHARRIGEAIAAYVAASRLAQAHGAYVEAGDQLTHALALLGDVDDLQQRVALELTIRQVRGFGAIALFGYSAPGAVEDFERCLDLCRQLEPRPEHLPSLVAAWSYYVLHGELERADEFNVEMRQVERNWPDGEPKGGMPEEAGWAVSRLFRGDIAGAIDAGRSFLASPYAHAPGITEGWPLPNDPVAAVGGHLALAESIHGEHAAAQATLARSYERAQSLPFPHGPFSVAYVRVFSAMVLAVVGAANERTDVIDEIMEIAERHGFLFFSICGTMQRAMVSARVGEPYATGLLEGAIAVWRSTGADAWSACFMTELGSALLASGDATRARAVLTEARSLAAQTGAEFWTSETLRLLGESRLALGDDGGLADIEAAVELAVLQEARMFELRGRTALCRITGGDAGGRLDRLISAIDSDTELPDVRAAREALASTPTR